MHPPGVSMQKYDIKRGFDKNLDLPQLKILAQECFGQAGEEGGKITASFGALAKLTAWPEGKGLCVETEMKMDVSNEVAADTIRRYNQFLERTTGFNSKERKKRLEAKAKKGKN